MATAGSLKEDRPKLRQSQRRRTLRNVKEHPVASFSIVTILLAICSLIGGFVDGWSLADRLFGQGTKPTPAAPDFAPATPPAREDSALAPVTPPAREDPALAPATPPAREDPALAPVTPPGREDPARAPVTTPAPENPVSTPASPTGRFLVDLPMTASDGAQPATCTTGGRTFPKSLLLSVPAGDPVRGSYARADYQVPPGLVTLTAIVGLVDEPPPHGPNPQVNVFIQSGSAKPQHEELIPYGTARSILVHVTAGQRLRIQASAGSGERRVCFGDIRLDP